MTQPMYPASTSASTYWSSRSDWRQALPEYWGATHQPHRRVLVDVVKTFSPIKELRELGCCAGTNLRMLRSVLPDLRMEGLDISKEAVAFAQDKFDRDPLVSIQYGDILEEAPLWPDRDADVTMTCFTLAHVHPSHLSDLLWHMLRASRIGLVMAEPFKGPVGQFEHATLSVWRHDYKAVLDPLLRRTGRYATFSAVEISDSVDFCDAIMTVRFAT